MRKWSVNALYVLGLTLDSRCFVLLIVINNHVPTHCRIYVYMSPFLFHSNSPTWQPSDTYLTIPHKKSQVVTKISIKETKKSILNENSSNISSFVSPFWKLVSIKWDRWAICHSHYTYCIIPGFVLILLYPLNSFSSILIVFFLYI